MAVNMHAALQPCDACSYRPIELALHVAEIIRLEIAGANVALDPAAQREINAALGRVIARLLSEIGGEVPGTTAPSASAGALRQRRYRERQRASRVTITDTT